MHAHLHLYQVLHWVNGDKNADAENGFQPNLHINVCVIINRMIKLTQTLTLMQKQALSVNMALTIKHLPWKDSFTMWTGVFLWSMEGSHVLSERHVILELFATFFTSEHTIRVHVTLPVFLHRGNLIKNIVNFTWNISVKLKVMDFLPICPHF